VDAVFAAATRNTFQPSGDQDAFASLELACGGRLW
jgi:hypothetical protein